MNLKLKVYECYCSTEIFEINGVNADIEDFGEQSDQNPDLAQDYCCADMKFIPKLPTQVILDKYKISVDEYKEICDELTDGLSFGECDWCF